jgi:hypothetical protein
MKICLHKLYILLFIIFCNSPASSQNKFELSGGAGYPELINLRMKYGGNFKIGLCQSILPFYDPPVPFGPTVLEFYYYFAGKSALNEQPVWYLLCGLGCFWDNPGGFYKEGIHLCFYPRIGRNINLSKNIGINLDAGVFPFYYNTLFYIHPSLSINLFFRL